MKGTKFQVLHKMPILLRSNCRTTPLSNELLFHLRWKTNIRKRRKTRRYMAPLVKKAQLLHSACVSYIKKILFQHILVHSINDSDKICGGAGILIKERSVAIKFIRR
jgi:hypothetical protein